ncbi:MAG: alpha-glucan family phosphorylase [Bacteriovoracaceae bacterium]|nr:alpha-glucan family phosphorylase [Bacteriovoracaceae bacterium]
MKLHTFTALPTTPPRLAPLLELANNMWFSWNWEARQLFKKINPELWISAHKNPLRVLCDVPQERLEELAEDDSFIAELQAVHSQFTTYMSSKPWFEEQYGPREKSTVAYFCCEFGIHESLPIYSGGLGVLAGDHLKSASDLGVPLVAVGFLYRQGYFRQGLNAEGIQQESYPENDFFSMPVVLEKDEKGRPIILSMDIGGDEVFYQIWKVQVGRVNLYLLDTNLHCNHPRHRDITKRLYEADRDMRLRQEILLGIGGVQALKSLGIEPDAYHINEGHSALLILERLRHLMENKMLSFEEAKEVIWGTNIFTTHTPVPAGNERFHCDAIKHYLGNFVQKRLGLRWEDFLSLGREEPHNHEEDFCLTVLALKFSSMCNGVAKLHGHVSRGMWQNIFPDIPYDEIPIGHVTNGVHSSTWLSSSFEKLFARYSQTSHVREIADFNMWKVVDEVPDHELWHGHVDRKKALIQYVRERLKLQYKKRGASASELSKVKDVLNPNALTIGFARRFAPYKRGAMFFEDVDRIMHLINNADRPVQIIFAGKAHPADQLGKEIIKRIADLAKLPELYRSVVFLEDYDLDMARYLVQGVDVWLNNPRRPMEASGTSGMKAAMNGALNVSILDGWWDEAYNGKNGWPIGHAESYDDLEYQDSMEASLLYRVLEDDVVPLYYSRDEMGIPSGWIEMMKNAIRECGEGFNAHRMVIDYIKNYYVKAEKLNETLTCDDYKGAKDLSKWRCATEKEWEEIEIIEIEAPEQEIIYSGTDVCVKARLRLGEIKADNLIVEVYYGTLDNDDQIKVPIRERMKKESSDGSVTTFSAMIPCPQGGRYGYTVRILPGHRNLAQSFIPGLVKWAN